MGIQPARENVANAVIAVEYALIAGGFLVEDALKTVAYYERTLSRAVSQLYRGEIDEGAFIDELIRLIEEQLRRAWNEGMRENDLDPKQDMTPEWEDILQGEIDGEFEHVLDFAEAIQKAREESQNITPLRNRVSYWTNRYNDVLNLSIVTTRPEDRFIWVYGDTQHCSTCLALNGIIATGKQWADSGYRPQNPPNEMLECGGWKCQCRLEPTGEAVTPGGIPNV